MYLNLKAEIIRKGLTAQEVADIMKINYVTFSKKMTSKSQFTIDECFQIKRILGTDLTLDELFQKSEV